MTKFIVVSRLVLAQFLPWRHPLRRRRAPKEDFSSKRHDAFKDFISIPHFEGDLEPTGIEAKLQSPL